MAQARVSSGDVTGASTKTLLAIFASATRIARIKQIVISCTDTPADATAVISVGFLTADGTGSAVTPGFVNGTLFHGGNPSCTAKANYSAEPTYATPRLSRQGINQRVTEIWNTPFDGEIATELSGGTEIGIGIQMVSGPALKYAVDVQWDE